MIKLNSDDPSERIGRVVAERNGIYQIDIAGEEAYIVREFWDSLERGDEVSEYDCVTCRRPEWFVELRQRFEEEDDE